jgi:hypothetical protein
MRAVAMRLPGRVVEIGDRGPVPKRSTARRRTNTPKTKTTKAPAAAKVAIPKVDAKWHPAAKSWYLSLGKSGQHKFYEPSDWALAWLLAESISRDLKPQIVGIVEETGDPVFAVIPMKGASLAAYLKAMSALLVTEGDRRRASIELERPRLNPPAENRDDVPRLSDYRDRLTS